ncbi:MAG: tetratricopeptide repeat protein [Candidatus Nealsonbacteria bacterium]|nr:tetratricopeptide repeat protein [Candidatus Nealsonbacteria bacterium]
MNAHLERGRLLYGQRRFEQAEQEIGLGLAEMPNDPLGHALMALCLVQREQYDEATEHAEQGVGLAPDLSFMHYTLAQVWLVRNHLDKAAAAVNEAISLDPLQAHLHVLLGKIEFMRDRWEPMLQSADAALAIDPEDTDAQNLRAQALRNLGRGASAADQLQAALQADPDNPWTHANLGWNYLETGRRDKAMEHFREALRLDPELEWARRGVVETLKARSRIYRMLLKFFLWMEKRSQAGQWSLILGLWIAFMVARQVVKAVPASGVILWPLMGAYIVFCLTTWLAVPLANLALRLHPFGRLALSRDERRASNWIGGFLFGGLISGVVYLLHPSSPSLRRDQPLLAADGAATGRHLSDRLAVAAQGDGGLHAGGWPVRRGDRRRSFHAQLLVAVAGLRSVGLATLGSGPK